MSTNQKSEQGSMTDMNPVRCVSGLSCLNACLVPLQETRWNLFMVFFSAAEVSSALTRRRRGAVLGLGGVCGGLSLLLLLPRKESCAIEIKLAAASDGRVVSECLPDILVKTSMLAWTCLSEDHQTDFY